eukprot:scaffold869_cov303-Pinguiococcus_pyrenoidosus.AAC.12
MPPMTRCNSTIHGMLLDTSGTPPSAEDSSTRRISAAGRGGAFATPGFMGVEGSQSNATLSVRPLSISVTGASRKRDSTKLHSRETLMLCSLSSSTVAWTPLCMGKASKLNKAQAGNSSGALDGAHLTFSFPPVRRRSSLRTVLATARPMR